MTMMRFFGRAIALGFLLGAGAVGAADIWQDTQSGITFVRTPGGCFVMGAAAPGQRVDGLPFTAPAKDEVPAHEVCVDGFWIGRTEVTRGQWQRVFGEAEVTHPEWPVADVRWDDAQRFAATLSQRIGRRIRLPSEVEWEYACHAGVPRPVVQPLGEERVRMLDELIEVAWYRHPYRSDPHAEEVGRKAPNAWGLFDMLGNVWEWTADDYAADAYLRHRRDNPQVDAGSLVKVIRGGSYRSEPPHARCGARNSLEDHDRSRVVGFRVVMEPNVAEGR